MSEVTISDLHRANYEHYYRDGESEWRRLGAIGKVANIVALCEDLPHESIVEIGAGEGSILNRLSELRFGARLYALEVSPSGAETIANRGIARLIECRTYDGYRVPYASDSFDIAILSHVVEHVEHPRLLLYEASRIAKFVFVEVPLEDTMRLPFDFRFDSVGHINFYSPKTLRRLVQSCNLRVIRQITANPPRGTYTYQKGIRGLIPFCIKEGLLKIAPAVATGLFTYHGALVCERQGR